MINDKWEANNNEKYKKNIRGMERVNDQKKEILQHMKWQNMHNFI